MTTAEFYEKKIQPFAFDDTIKYADLWWFQKVFIWFQAKITGDL